MQDSNLRRQCHLIYSQAPLTAWVIHRPSQLRRPPNFVSLHRPSSFPLKLILSIFPPWRGLEGVPYGHLELSSHQCLHDHLRLWTISSGVSPSSYMLPSTTKTISFLNLKCEPRCFQQNYIIPKNASLFNTGNSILANLLHT